MNHNTNHGSTFVHTLLITVLISLCVVLLGNQVGRELQLGKTHHSSQQARWLAEAGIQHALARIAAGMNSNVLDGKLETGAYQVVRVSGSENTILLEATGTVPLRLGGAGLQRTIRVTVTPHGNAPVITSWNE